MDIVQQIESLWGPEPISYHQTEEGAVAALKKVVTEHVKRERSNKNLGDKEVTPKHKSGELYVPEPQPHDLKVLMQADVDFWQKTSYEYDEYDVSSTSFRVIERELMH